MSSTSPTTPYGEWRSASAPFAIRYSQSLLQKIDFFVGDAYRRIPHGGLEVGGLLYGSAADGELTLVAYQPIECQHSKGPGFVLSDADLEALRKQLAEPFRHDNTEQTIAGWFISHCRSELVMTPREVELFSELFPGPYAATLLVKPEKFKATQYGFVTRSAAGTLDDTRCQNPFLLPLTARPEGVSTERPGGQPRASRRLSRRGPMASPAETTTNPPTSVQAKGPKDAAGAVGEGAQLKEAAVVPAQPPLFAESAAAPLPATREASQLHERETSGNGVPSPEPSRGEPADLTKTEAVREDEHEEGEHEEMEEIEPPTFGVPRVEPQRFVLSSRMQAALAATLVAVFSFAAVWTYLNFLLSPIPLSEEMNGGKPVVKWPADATAGTDGPWLNMWVDGEPSSRALTALEQERGEATLEGAGTDVIVQLHVPHWLYERRGMVRMIRIPPAKPIQPTQQVKRGESTGAPASRHARR